MKKSLKLLSLILAALMTVPSFIACSETTADKTETAKNAETSGTAADPSAAETEE